MANVTLAKFLLKPNLLKDSLLNTYYTNRVVLLQLTNHCEHTVIRDTLVEEMSRGSSVVVMATAQAINAVHPKLLPSRGNHLFRKTIEISTPNVVSNIIHTIC